MMGNISWAQQVADMSADDFICANGTTAWRLTIVQVQRKLITKPQKINILHVFYQVSIQIFRPNTFILSQFAIFIIANPVHHPIHIDFHDLAVNYPLKQHTLIFSHLHNRLQQARSLHKRRGRGPSVQHRLSLAIVGCGHDMEDLNWSSEVSIEKCEFSGRLVTAYPLLHVLKLIIKQTLSKYHSKNRKLTLCYGKKTFFNSSIGKYLITV